jgi:hypothetical protein
LLPKTGTSIIYSCIHPSSISNGRPSEIDSIEEKFFD